MVPDYFDRRRLMDNRGAGAGAPEFGSDGHQTDITSPPPDAAAYAMERWPGRGRRVHALRARADSRKPGAPMERRDAGRPVHLRFQRR
jgi:hypothetical protein